MTKKPVLVSGEMEMSVMKNKIAELKAQVNNQSSRDRERAISASGEGFNIVSMLNTATVVVTSKHVVVTFLVYSSAWRIM